MHGQQNIKKIKKINKNRRSGFATLIYQDITFVCEVLLLYTTLYFVLQSKLCSGNLSFYSKYLEKVYFRELLHCRSVTLCPRLAYNIH